MGKTVLVVDDELHLRLFIKAVFETAGHEVVTAANGSQGMQRAKECKPDIITLDLMMPGEGGIRMYRQLKEDGELQDTPVMIVSAVDDASFRHALKLINASGSPVPEPEVYIGKPPTPERLLEGAARLVDGM